MWQLAPVYPIFANPGFNLGQNKISDIFQEKLSVNNDKRFLGGCDVSLAVDKIFWRK